MLGKIIFVLLFINSSDLHAQNPAVSGMGIQHRDIPFKVEYEEALSLLNNLTEKLALVLDCNAQGQVFDEGAGSCRDIIAPEHQWSGTQLQFKNADGSWGSQVDLQGPPGAVGPQGSCP